MLLIQKNHNQCCSDAEAEQCCPAPILSVSEFLASASEILQPNLSHMHRNSAIALGGESWGNTFAATNLHAAKLAGINLLGVESAGSGCCPGIKTTELSGDAHAPFGIDQIDIAPTQFDLLDRVDDVNAIIGVNDVGPDKNQVDQDICCATSSNRTGQTLSQGRRPDEESRENGSSAAQEVTTPSSKDLWLAHDSIFSYTSHFTDGQVA